MVTRQLTTDVFQTAVDFIDSGTRFAMLLILRDRGSTPRKAGTRALVDAAGDIWGTIGGGLLEAECRRLARDALDTGRVLVHELQFTGTDASGDDPVCGGEVSVLIDPQPARHRAALAAAARALRRRVPGALTTRCRGREALEVEMVFHEERPAYRHESPRYFSEPRGEGLVEPLLPRARLIVVGGGHVGQALARAAALAEFEIVILEDRPEFADPALFPPGVIARCGESRQLLDDLVADDQTALVLVSRGHRSDAEALAVAIGQPWGYIGMMGSRRKVALLREQFLRDDLATPQEWARLHAPIGLEIGAQTVPEIAISIVAQLIQVLRRVAKERT